MRKVGWRCRPLSSRYPSGYHSDGRPANRHETSLSRCLGALSGKSLLTYEDVEQRDWQTLKWQIAYSVQYMRTQAQRHIIGARHHQENRHLQHFRHQRHSTEE